MKLFVRFSFIIITWSLVCCKEDPKPCSDPINNQPFIDAVPKTRLNTDVGRITTYLNTNSITAIEDPSGMRYEITSLGAGPMIQCLEAEVTIKYSGKILESNGKLSPSPFDSQPGPISFHLNDLTLGWQVVLPKLPKGTSATMYMPSGFGYGTKELAVPANSILVFQIELIDFK